jgi:hypothetical protein
VTYLQELWLHVFAGHQVQLFEIQFQAEGLGGQQNAAAWRRSQGVVEVHGDKLNTEKGTTKSTHRDERLHTASSVDKVRDQTDAENACIFALFDSKM